MAILASPAVSQLIATVLVVDLRGGGLIELASGGHPAPLVVGDGSVSPFGLKGLMPGLKRGCDAQPRRLRLKEGERLFMATDGLAPASSETLEGIPDALHAAIVQSRAMPIEAAADSIEAAAVKAFGARPDDDWTFVLIEAVC